jgi:hypothetical protein
VLLNGKKRRLDFGAVVSYLHRNQIYHAFFLPIFSISSSCQQNEPSVDATYIDYLLMVHHLFYRSRPELSTRYAQIDHELLVPTERLHVWITKHGIKILIVLANTKSMTHNRNHGSAHLESIRWLSSLSDG